MPQFSRSQERGGVGGMSGGGGMNKKKFGKNLNHALSKPAAPPIPSDRSSHSARNGLLLLSTKKSSAGLLASKTNATISSNGPNGINGNGIKAGSSLNLQAQPNPSTHEVLLSAVVGASQVETQQKRDAWGVADLAKDQQAQYDISQDLAEEEKYPEQDRDNDSRDSHADRSFGEYGARGRSGSGASGSFGEKTDDQVAYMSRLARERAQIKSQEEESRSAEQKAKAEKRLKELEQKKAIVNDAKIISPEDSQKSRGSSEAGGLAGKSGRESSKGSVGSVKSDKDGDLNDPAEPVIHLSSYEDRDRGERGTGSAPRMLFDPKSGSMVAVKAKPETSAPREKPRKERRPKPKKEREAAPVVVMKSGRNIKQKGPRKETSGNVQYEKKKANPSRRLPRTRGVLYRRDGKGKLRSVDECGGDIDFGLHCVPGGRVRNPEAYSTWSEQSELSYGDDDYCAGDIRLVGFGDSSHGVTLETGFTPEEQQPMMEWIKADDKLELITGVDDSPTLKPTAKVFAPSEAALAAAAAAATSAKDYSDASSLVDTRRDDESEEDEVSEEDEDDGLFFDPLHGIDFMGSPHHKSPEEIATADLPPLDLAPPMFSGDESALSRPLFGFGTSGTWGSSQMNDNVLSGWGSGTGGVGLFGSDVFLQGQKDSEPPPFLASTSSSWGPSSVPGLDRLPSINASEHATGPVD